MKFKLELNTEESRVVGLGSFDRFSDIEQTGADYNDYGK